MTHYKKLMNPLYLGAYSVEDGKDLVLTIREVKTEMVVGADGKKEECVVIYFSDADKPMIANSTNLKMIAKVLKSPMIENWVGKKIQIGVEPVRAFGDVVEALRVRKFAPAQNASVKAVKCENCGRDIGPANGMSGAEVAAYTAKKYGKPICAECAKAIQKG